MSDAMKESFVEHFDIDDINKLTSRRKRDYMVWVAAWQASRRAALEASAKVCDDISLDRWNLYKGRAPYTVAEAGRADPHVQGESDGADKCADALRALAQKEAGGV